MGGRREEQGEGGEQEERSGETKTGRERGKGREGKREENKRRGGRQKEGQGRERGGQEWRKERRNQRRKAKSDKCHEKRNQNVFRAQSGGERSGVRLHLSSVSP